jgi:hypothetical protein
VILLIGPTSDHDGLHTCLIRETPSFNRARTFRLAFDPSFVMLSGVQNSDSFGNSNAAGMTPAPTNRTGLIHSRKVGGLASVKRNLRK